MGERLAEIMRLVRNVVEEENMRATVKGSMRSGLAAGVGGAVGCLLGGPWGGVPGAALGAALAAATGEDFKPLWQVIAEWPQETQQKLADNIENIRQRVNATDIVALAAMAAGAGTALKAEIAGAIIEFCGNEMNLQVARR